jgi:hypothetical protein
MVSKRKVACAVAAVIFGVILCFSLAALTEVGFEGFLDSPYVIGLAVGVAGLFVSGVLATSKADKASSVKKDVSVNSPSVSKRSKGSVVDASAIPVLSGRIMNDFVDITFQESYVWLKLAEGYQIVKVTEASTAPEEKDDPLNGAFAPC